MYYFWNKIEKGIYKSISREYNLKQQKCKKYEKQIISGTEQRGNGGCFITLRIFEQKYKCIN